MLKKAFPRKFDDPEWGSWSGAFFGVYFGHAGREGRVSVGDTVSITSTTTWDAHLRTGWGQMPRGRYVLLVLALAVALFAVFMGIGEVGSAVGILPRS